MKLNPSRSLGYALLLYTVETVFQSVLWDISKSINRRLKDAPQIKQSI
uniref:Uncharacterized protein n=1 Tax=Arundo donax TaxID=35708 RepID=A0A0A9FU62_ARUDO